MGIEGGGFEGNYPVRRAEITPRVYPVGEIEASGRGAEHSLATEPTFGLPDVLSGDRFGRIRNYPAYQESSAEWVILEILGAQLVEQGGDMDPAKRAHLSNLVAVLRGMFYPNMTEEEQAFTQDLYTNTTTVNFSTMQHEITPEVQKDVRWIWRNFGLRIPDVEQQQMVPRDIYQMIDQPSPEKE